ncbi:leucine-rich alpha-2-glycoprotein [Betta splendens]|uniref:Leucine-rich alpha-2-glycoprotein n=1 Tax=Betta splendens TaxID=158456 RepID=A0A6P7LVG1_BETSP|nr:leucine-rich alpha-2-glycoprotein [Betta splendens]XP_040925484.1 leucine-rich alpha-2-glycoprotein [Betta splendens]
MISLGDSLPLNGPVLNLLNSCLVDSPVKKTMNARRTLAALCWACFFHGALSCPALCQCYARRREVVCSEAPLTQYPSEGLPRDTAMLTVQFTNVSSVSERQLGATPLLEELHLYSNRLRSLSPHLLRGAPRLNTLDLTGNNLTDLPADVFSPAPRCSLVLKNNRLHKADAEWFPGNSSLTWLDLSGNRLTGVPGALLQKLPHLENLDLSNNNLEKIPAGSLDPLSKLERLNLHNNKLRTLEDSVLRGARNLTYLFLSRNKLSALPQKLFQELSQLRILNLEDNQLSHVPAGLLDRLRSLDEQGLDLASNPWLCDGRLEYLWRWLQENKEKVFLPDAVTCAGPPELSGRSVLSLTESDLKL